jgi:hypothetical protein
VLEEADAARAWVARPTPALTADARQILEIAIPFTDLGAGPGTRLACFLSLHLNDAELERYPGHHALEIQVPSPEFEAYNWTA